MVRMSIDTSFHFSIGQGVDVAKYKLSLGMILNKILGMSKLKKHFPQRLLVSPILSLHQKQLQAIEKFQSPKPFVFCLKKNTKMILQLMGSLINVLFSVL